MERAVEVELVKMIDPGCYLLRELGLGEENQLFDELCLEMDAYFNSEAFVSKAVTPVLGQCYFGKERDKWYRVRVDQIVQRTTGPHASCYLLDYGKDCVMIPLRWLRECRDEFFRLPFLVKSCVLHNIHPVTLLMDRELNTKLGPAHKWDESSVVFMKDIFKRATLWKASFLSNSDDKYNIELYALDGVNTLSINELLVSKEYAAFNNQLEGSFEISSPSEKSLQEHRAADCSGFSAVNSNGTRCSADSLMSSKTADMSVNAMGRGSLLKSLIASQSTPLVGLKAAERVGRGCRLNGSLPSNTTIGEVSPSASYSASSGSEQDSQPSPGRAALSRTGGAVSSGSDREFPLSSGGDVLHSGTLFHSPGATLSAGSYEGASHSTGETVVQEHRSPKEAAVPETSPVQSLIKSRLPKHLKASSVINTIPAVSSVSLDFVIPNTNASTVQSLRRRSPMENSKPEVAVERPCTAEVRNVVSVPSLKSDPVEASLHKEVKQCDSNEPQLSSRLALPSASCDTTRQLTAEDLEILVDGSMFVKCVTDIGSQPFADLIQNTPGFYNISRPTKLQSFIWPSVMRGLDVIGICQSRNKDGSPGGKTLSYLLPLISVLNFRSTYKDLPKYSTSPYVLILCPHWSLVLDVYDQCQHVLHYQDKLRLHQIRLRVHMLFGGGGDENQEVNLINGCEILVSTPSSFLRMMETKLISFKRVSHLVLEDADILMEQFKPEMDQLMSQYKLELKERQGCSAPQQVLIFSQRWSPSLKEFSLENQVCPVVVVAAKMESAYYGRVKQQPLMCSAQQRYNQILSLLGSKRKKVLIFTSDTAEAKQLYQMTRASSIYTLLAHDEMNSSDLAKVNRDWNLPHRDDSQPVLVLTDIALGLLSISDASWVIHFDVPPLLDVFANRLWCLRDYFERYEDKKECIVDECISFIFITNECQPLSSRLIRVLQRCRENIPAELAKMSEQHMEAVEKGKRSLLCHNLKSFGFCRHKNLCHRRHKVFSSLDQPGLMPCYIKLPTEGTVKVWIKHVVDASFYYVQLVEHRDLDGNVTSLRTESTNLSMEMAHHFSRVSNRHHLETAEPSKLYAREDIQHIFHRVEVLNVFMTDSSNYPDQAEVFYVDIGQTLEIPIAELYELPPHLTKIPYQAVEVFVCRIKPVDRDVSWTKKASVYVSEIIQSQILEGNIVLSLGNSLWLDPLVKRDWLEDMKVCQTVFTIRSLLLDAKYADENPKHLERLYKACEGIIQLPVGVSTAINTTHAYTDDGRLILTKTEEFPDGDNSFQDVYVTAVLSPDLLYVQLASNEKVLSELNENIYRTMLLPEERKDLEPKKGLLVLAKDPATARWNRARIEVVAEGKLLEVFFVDTGITEDLSCDDLVPMPLHFKQLPFQAIECSLIGLESDVDGYLDSSAEAILSLTGDDSARMVKVQAQVVRKTEARYTGRHQYGINLCNWTSTCYHVNVASQLVVTNYARLSSDKLKELYPMAYDDQGTSVAHRISKLCRNILVSREAEVRRENALELHSVMREICSGTESCTGLVAIVGQTLEFTWELEPAEALLMSLQLLAKSNPSHCMELEQNETWDTLCHIFVKHESNNLLDGMVLVLESMLTCIRCCEMFVECGGLWYLGHFLLNSQLDFVIRILSQLIKMTLVNTHDSGRTSGHSECLKAAIHHVSSQDPTITDVCLQVIKHLVRSQSRHKDHIRKYGGIRALCEKIADWPDIELVSKGVELLTILATDNRFNRDEMVKWSAGTVLNRLSERPDLNLETRRLCADLMRRIRPLLPRNQLEASEQKEPMVNGSGRSKQTTHQTLNNHPIPKERLNIISENRRPSVRWTQSSWDILLTVEIKDAQNSPDITLTEDSLQFHAIAMSTEYSFRFVLYELIVPESCETSVSAGCIYVGLKKKSRGPWPRLLRDKHLKCPFLSIDFSRFEDVHDSSSGDDEDEEHKSPLHLMYMKKEKLIKWNLPEDDGESAYKNATPDFADHRLRNRRISTCSTSSSDSESDIDAKFDPRLAEDSKLGYHVF